MSDVSRAEQPASDRTHGFQLVLPKNWYEFDIHPATRDDNIRRVVRQRIAEMPDLAPREKELVRALRRLSREAWHNGVHYCGCMAELVDEEAPLVASLTVALVRGRDGRGRSLDSAPEAIAASLTPVARGRRPTDMWREVSVVDLPEVGAAARTAGIEDVDIPQDHRTARLVMSQTFVPVPQGEGRVAVITGASPQLELAEPFLEMFSAITTSFRFV